MPASQTQEPQAHYNPVHVLAAQSDHIAWDVFWERNRPGQPNPAQISLTLPGTTMDGKTHPWNILAVPLRTEDDTARPDRILHADAFADTQDLLTLWWNTHTLHHRVARTVHAAIPELDLDALAAALALVIPAGHAPARAIGGVLRPHRADSPYYATTRIATGTPHRPPREPNPHNPNNLTLAAQMLSLLIAHLTVEPAR